MNVDTPRRSLTGAVAPALAIAGAAGLGALLIVAMFDREGRTTSTDPNCILENVDAIGGPIELVDGAGATVTQAAFAGEPAVVYFGFAHCPAICPTAMFTLAQALAQPSGHDLQPVLISLDPERDTPEVMQAFARTDGFPAGLVGLTGSPAQVDAAKAAFRVYARREPVQGAPSDVYNVDHSSFLYVMDDRWRTRAVFNTIGATPEAMAQCIRAGLARDG